MRIINKHAYATKIVGEPKGEFGTRLSQRVTCEKCQKIDYVTVKLSKIHQKFCRSCAQDVLKVYEVGRHILEENKKCMCEKCGKNFFMKDILLAKKHENAQEILCFDCHKGFDVWRGKASNSPSLIITEFIKTSSCTVLRKSK